jgi:ribosomal subunit interface protein
MRINYTGKLSGLTDDQQTKLQARFAKLSKLLDSPAEQRQAHVIIKTERRLTKAEITLHYYGHEVVGASSDADPYSAMTDAAHKLETQILKLRKKWVDSKRHGVSASKAGLAAAEPAPVKEKVRTPKVRIYRPSLVESAKPMTAAEAVASLRKKDNYFLFREIDTDASALVVRRPDGHFDVIELQ